LNYGELTDSVQDYKGCVFQQYAVMRNQVQGFGNRLCNQHPVERVSMVIGKSGENQSMLGSYR